ncbi:site-specific DNA-methyltransferase [Orrella sp. 11846]|uniref:site-specific DNA-methyltransferase n=1 Tax=Orrella sp. 11846 TaxID=3409913 RepID=UPI003B5AD50B
MTDKAQLESIPATSMDMTEHNLEQLKSLFPNVFTEGKVDFEALKAELGEHVETANERYQFTWAGKEQAKRIATTPSLGTLRPAPDESVDWDNTENLYIEGDNLEVLKLLQKSYFSKVKMIYIDPPYNTGKDFVYKDDFKDNLANYQRLTGQRDEEGNPLFTNTDTAGRYHSNWLNMMYPRLKLARNLLRDDGVIFISIDDNEVHNLRKICDEIFGETNLVTQIPWQSRTSVQNDTDISDQHEYILVYAKVRRQENRRLKESNAEKWFEMGSFAAYPLPLNESRYENLDDDPRGKWKADPFDAPNVRENLTYKIVNPNTGAEYWPPQGRCWRTEEHKYLELLADNRIVFGRTGESRPQLKVFYEEKKIFGEVPTTWFDGSSYGTSTQGTQELQAVFEGRSPFSFPKPTKLIRFLLELTTRNNGVILDFFSGSSTTAHAIMQLNAEDNGNRKFIMVQIPEPTPENSEARKAGYPNIAEIGKERIRRAATKIREEYPETQADMGFKVLKLDTSNLKKWQPDYDNLADGLLAAVNNIIPGRTSEDLLYEVLIKYGLPLTLPVEKQQVNGHTIYNVASGSLVACFDENIDLNTVQAIIDLGTADAPILRIVFRDSSFADDIVKTNAIQRFKQAGIDDVLSI